jgi:hypothetical protein
MTTSDGSSIFGMGLSSNLASNGPYRKHEGFCISDKETEFIFQTVDGKQISVSSEGFGKSTKC